MIHGKLDYWWYDPHNHVVWGHISGDTKGRFHDGSYIHTSNLSMERDPKLYEGLVVQTCNSRYELGVPAR